MSRRRWTNGNVRNQRLHIRPLQFSRVPGLSVFSSAAIGRRRSAAAAAFSLGQGSQGRQVRARSGQVGAAPLLLLLLKATALGAPTTHPAGPHQHAVTGVTVEVVFAPHRPVVFSWKKKKRHIGAAMTRVVRPNSAKTGAALTTRLQLLLLAAV